MAHRTQSLGFGEHPKAVLEETTGEGFAPVRAFPGPAAVPWAQLRELLKRAPRENKAGPCSSH